MSHVQNQVNRLYVCVACDDVCSCRQREHTGPQVWFADAVLAHHVCTVNQPVHVLCL
jgi:hypothetical protein